MPAETPPNGEGRWTCSLWGRSKVPLWNNSSGRNWNGQETMPTMLMGKASGRTRAFLRELAEVEKVCVESICLLSIWSVTQKAIPATIWSWRPLLEKCLFRVLWWSKSIWGKQSLEALQSLFLGYNCSGIPSLWDTEVTQGRCHFSKGTDILICCCPKQQQKNLVALQSNVIKV